MQTYGSIIPGGPTLARILPKAASEARDPPLSRETKRRLGVVGWHDAHGKSVSLTARHFGLSRSTVYDWLKRHAKDGTRGLQERSLELLLRNGSAQAIGYNLCASTLERRSGDGWQPVASQRVCTMELRLLGRGAPHLSRTSSGRLAIRSRSNRLGEPADHALGARVPIPVAN